MYFMNYYDVITYFVVEINEKNIKTRQRGGGVFKKLFNTGVEEIRGFLSSVSMEPCSKHMKAGE
ncbi:hypothetical protein PAECIP112173_03529 [Paenibacillus sp. JJ-100]|nr:hypothetical protein PAECIP112173_03529 [Paenibacillus sp. JJ-100]